MPAQLRPAVLAIYRFARHADDLADEGDVPTSEREVALQALHSALDEAARGVPSGVPVVDGLVASVQRHGLHWRHFHDLLDAFLQDLRVTRYDTEAQVQDYCRRSAFLPARRRGRRLYPETVLSHERFYLCNHRYVLAYFLQVSYLFYYETSLFQGLPYAFP